MKSIVSFAFISCASLLVAASGCSAEGPQDISANSQAALGTETPGEQAQVDTEDQTLASEDMDLEEVDAADDELAIGLAGPSADKEDQIADATDLDSVDALVKENPGRFFSPAGCLVSTRLGQGEWSHVMSNCEGPKSRFKYSGTVTAKWSFKDGVLSVNRDAKDLVITGKRLTVMGNGKGSVSFTRAAGVVTRQRMGDFKGTIARNAEGARAIPFTHKADFTTTWNRMSKEFTRAGSAEATIGRRTIERTVTGYKASGSRLACPSAGEVVISRKGGERKLTITFLGGQEAKVTGARGRSVMRTIECGE